MTFFENETLWWSKITSIGQCLGAIATFLAVGISLHLANRDNCTKYEINSTVTYDNKGISLLKVTFVNTGKVSIPISNKFLLIIPGSIARDIKPRTIKSAASSYKLLPGDYIEVYFDLNYIIKRLKFAKINPSEYSFIRIALENPLGEKFIYNLPKIPKKFL